jgi:hypothetical protein
MYDPQWEENVSDTHRQVADQHELAAHAHRTAAEHDEKGKNELGNWHLQRALEHSGHAYKLAKEAHPNSGQTSPRTITRLPNCTTVPLMPIVLCKRAKIAVR